MEDEGSEDQQALVERSLMREQQLMTMFPPSKRVCFTGLITSAARNGCIKSRNLMIIQLHITMQYKIISISKGSSHC